MLIQSEYSIIKSILNDTIMQRKTCHWQVFLACKNTFIIPTFAETLMTKDYDTITHRRTDDDFDRFRLRG